MQYAYLNKRTLDLKTEINKLKELICYYLATYAKLMIRNIAFIALIKEGGPFTRDL
jgi:hypothetical protein